MTTPKCLLLGVLGILLPLRGLSSPLPEARAGSTGILLELEGASLRIRHLILGSPARDSGELDVGDELVGVAEHGQARMPLEGKTVAEALELLSGPPGSEVTVFVHTGIGTARAVRLTRAKLNRGIASADLQLLDEGAEVPDFAFTDLATGRTHRFATLRGEPVMLVFWATWDPRSRAAMASLQRRLPELPPEARRRILTVNIDHSPEDALDYIATREWAGIRHAWTDGEAPERFRIRKLPEAFLIDAGGLLRRTGDPTTLDPAAFLTPAPDPP